MESKNVSNSRFRLLVLLICKDNFFIVVSFLLLPLFEFFFTEEKASSVRETVARIERRNMEKKCSGSVVQTVAKALDDNAVYKMFFKDNVRLKKGRFD